MLLPYLKENCVEAGCDEAGRGCLAGAVYAAAVILPPDFKNELLNDSKQLIEKQRYALREVIEKEAVDYAIGIVSPEEIDKINILNASFLAMHRALDALKVRPEHLLIDGNRFRKYQDVAHTTVVKGDGKYMSIAASPAKPLAIAPKLSDKSLSVFITRLSDKSVRLSRFADKSAFFICSSDGKLVTFPV